MSDAEHNLHAPIRSLTGVQIVGVGSYVPEQAVRNEDLAALGCDPEWILRRPGIRERRAAPPVKARSRRRPRAPQPELCPPPAAISQKSLAPPGSLPPHFPRPPTA